MNKLPLKTRVQILQMLCKGLIPIESRRLSAVRHARMSAIIMVSDTLRKSSDNPMFKTFIVARISTAQVQGSRRS